MPPSVEFPPNFLWGTAISAHQVEGNNRNSDWWAWEQGPAFTGSERSGNAANHWELYKTDFSLAKNLGLNAQRLSVEWARIEPEPGVWSHQALAHYRAMLEFLKERSFQTMLTLHHFTNPLWLARQNGWRSRTVVQRFQQYAEILARELGHLVDYWVPINEPTVYVTYAYLSGLWPPRMRSLPTGFQVFRNMIDAHRAAYRAIHRLQPKAPIGTAHHMMALEPARADSRWDRVLVAVLGWVNNVWFLNGVRDSLDFIGVNYYHRKRIRFSLRTWRQYFCETLPCEGPRTDLGWEIYPAGLYTLLLSLRKLGLPVYVTENGIADAEDRQRAEFILGHLSQIQRAIKDGVPVQGYFYWSLLDNYEWQLGFAPRFGLIEVNYSTQERRLRPSAQIFGAIARANAMPPAGVS